MDCNKAVSSLLSSRLSSWRSADLVLTSGYYGAVIAAKMLGHYSAVIIKNPVLDLTRALVEEPNIIRRAFHTQSDR